MELKKEWVRLTNTLIKEFEDKTKYLFVFKSNNLANDYYCSEPSWIYNMLEQYDYNDSINILVLKKENGLYRNIRYYYFSKKDEKLICYLF